MPTIPFLLTLLLTLTIALPAVAQSNEVLARRDRFGDPPETAPLASAFRALPPFPAPKWTRFDTTWSFALGDPAEGLNTTLSHLPRKLVPVSLPHRILNPDTPYWYSATVRFTRAVMLRVSADDGSQVYVNGRRIPVEHGGYFAIPSSPESIALVIRVLNKAVYGGLNSVDWVEEETCRVWWARGARRNRLERLVRKVRSTELPDPAEITAVQAAVREVFNPEDTALVAAEKKLAERPVTLLGPYLQDATTRSVTIVWETDAPCQPTFEWAIGADPSTFRTSPVTTEGGTLHTVRLTELAPSKPYCYRFRNIVRETGDPTVGHIYRVRSLPSSGPFTFTAWADSQNAWQVFARNVDAMRLVVPDAVFTVGIGDLVEGAYDVAPWHGLLQTLTPLASEMPAYLVPGNHDYDGLFEDLRSPHLERYLRASPRPQYAAWTCGNARFVALDPNDHFPTAIPADSPAHRWLLSEVKSPEWKAAKWHFIFIHQPPYAQGWADYHGDPAIRDLLEPLIEPHGIDFIVSGHAHDYERWQKVYGKQTCHFLIVGGAGGGLEDEPMSDSPKMDRVIRRHHFGVFHVDADTVNFEAVATDTRILDRLTVSKP